jgi:hypothetical protein
MLELTQPTRMGTTRHAAIAVDFTDGVFAGCEWRWLPTIVRLGVDLPVCLGLMAIEDTVRGTSVCRWWSAQSGWRCTCGELIALGVQRGT